MYQRKDVVRRAADIWVVSGYSFVDSLLEALRPPLLELCKISGTVFFRL
jgi:hypothetical protein